VSEIDIDFRDSRAGRYKLPVALLFAVIVFTLTLAIEHLGPSSENPIIEAAQIVGMVLIIPGLIGSVAFSGNVHAFPLWLAAVLNALLYFGIGWFAIYLVERFVRNRKRQLL
jgi:hypothetical protein